MSEPGSNFSEDGDKPKFRKIRIHKMRPASADATPFSNKSKTEAMDRQIAELIPGIADLSLTEQTVTGSLRSASDVRKQKLSREEAHRAELMELSSIYDMSIPNPVENQMPNEPWSQQLRPRVRKIVLSPYQYEMINYQRMLTRKNIWYYRDRMNVPRGPCPLHVLKDAWVQGVIDENTLMWGQGLYDWLPAKNIKLLLPMIRTPEVRFGAWMKKTFSLKPALNSIRENRKDHRAAEQLSKQVDFMR
mmetsp:Transcript_32324/g.71510  ORF Transcript_32324/g.71510 Transcript_32324/m.71510 type:complete len:247 (+) Transcript_32324:119-859(+)